MRDWERPRHERHVRLLGRVGRADLLQSLAGSGGPWFPLEHGEGGQTAGFLRRSSSQHTALQQFGRAVQQEGESNNQVSPPEPLRPLQAPRLWAAVTREDDPRDPDAVADHDPPLTPTHRTALAPLFADRPSPAEPDHWQAVHALAPLWPLPALRPRLRELLARQRDDRPLPSRVDWKACVNRLARLQPIRPLPLRCVSRWPPNATVLLDTHADAMQPFSDAAEQLVKHLARWIGHHALRVATLRLDPMLLPRLRSRRAERFTWGAAQDWVLILSDMGGGARDRSTGHPAASRWHGFAGLLQGLHHRGHPCAVLAPVPVQLAPSMPRPAYLLPWGSGAARACGGLATLVAVPESPDLLSLLALMLLSHRTSDLLLAALSRLLPAGQADPALAWLAWNHPDVEVRGRHAWIKPELAERHARRLARLAVPLLLEAHRVRQRLQCGLPAMDEARAILAICAFAPQVRSALAQSEADAVSMLRQHEQAWVSHTKEERFRKAGDMLWLTGTLPTEALTGRIRLFRRLVSQACDQALRNGETLILPQVLGPIEPMDGLDDPTGHADQRECQLLLQGRMLVLRALPAPGRPVLPCLWQGLLPAPQRHGMVVQTSEGGRWLPLDLERDHAVVDREGVGERLEITVGACRVDVLPLCRPAWASAWAQTPEGIEAILMLPWGQSHTLRWPPGVAELSSAEQPLKAAVGHAATGLVARVKRLAEPFVSPAREAAWTLTVDTAGPLLVWRPPGTGEQGFRYVPPGTFLMGSSMEDLADLGGKAFNDEAPRHTVSLSHGYWLADTPCTQGLWKAVMKGKNPSRFQEGEAEDLPVEQVSFDDVQAFLEALRPMLPQGCEAVLPTEAQWEHACRAGTQTAYWWGDEPDASRANMDERVGRTTPVKQYGANPWGLHDMHGNVWEWCADGLRDYGEAPVVDPVGPLGGARRAVRGGSWIHHAAGARAAFRDGRLRDYRDDNLGFRLALRSQGPGGAVLGQAGGQPVARPEGAPLSRGPQRKGRSP